MYFLPVICLFLGAYFYIQGRRHHADATRGLGITLMLAALGISFIVFFALNALK
jgi:hypothetical protein